MSELVASMRSTVNGLAGDLADELRGVDGAVERFLAEFGVGGDTEGAASAALHRHPRRKPRP